MSDLTNVTIQSLYNARDMISEELDSARRRLLKRAERMTRCGTNNYEGLSITAHSHLLADLNEELVQLHAEFLNVSTEILKRRRLNEAA